MHDIASDEFLDQLRRLDGEPAWRGFIVARPEVFHDESLLAWLKAESERLHTIDPQRSLVLAGALCLAAEIAGRADHHHVGLMAVGDALRNLGRFQESITLFDRAGAAFLAAGDDFGWARTRLGWLLSSHFLGAGEQALGTLDHAHAILVAHQAWLRAGHLDLNAAWVCHELGRYDQALALYDRAEAMYSRLGEAAEACVGWAKANRALLLTFLGDFQSALRLHDEARASFVRHGDSISVMRQDHNIAFVYATQGYFTRALQSYSTALGMAERIGLPVDAGWIMLNMVECYLSLNHNREALVLAEEATCRFADAKSPTELGKAHFFCALAQARLGNVDEALHLLTLAATALDEAGLTVPYGTVLLQRAQLHLDAGNWIAARSVAITARDLFADRALFIRQSQADLVLGRAALELGEADEAAQRAHDVLHASLDHDVGWLAHECHHLLGRVASTRGDLEAAADRYEQAISAIERVQATLAIDLRTNFLDDKLLMYEDAITTALTQNKAGRSFAYLERAKSRALVDYLANHLDVQVRARAGGNPELQAELTRLRAEHNALYARRFGGELMPRVDTTAEDNERLLGEIRKRERTIERLVERLALARMEGLTPYASPEFGTPPDLEPGTALVEYFFTAERGAAFVVDQGHIRWVPLGVGAADIRRMMVRWQLNLAATGQAMVRGARTDSLQRAALHILAALYRALLEPVEPLIEGNGRLIVVPYGPSHGVPFHALYDGSRFLVERMDVSCSPSSQLLKLCRTTPRRSEWSALVMAHTNGGRLPHVLREAELVAGSVPSECYREGAATRDAFLQAAPRHAIVHLAAHAESRLDNPGFAHVQLADGQLSTVDIFNLDLTGALVTLSACETGRAMVTGGDELVGLTRGFLYAGASTILHSLWQVEDGATARLMSAFYRALKDGRPTGTAWREAQLGMLAEHRSCPYLWAPFQLTGDSGSLLSEESDRTRRRRI